MRPNSLWQHNSTGVNIYLVISMCFSFMKYYCWVKWLSPLLLGFVFRKSTYHVPPTLCNNNSLSLCIEHLIYSLDDVYIQHMRYSPLPVIKYLSFYCKILCVLCIHSQHHVAFDSVMVPAVCFKNKCILIHLILDRALTLQNRLISVYSQIRQMSTLTYHNWNRSMQHPAHILQQGSLLSIQTVMISHFLA